MHALDDMELLQGYASRGSEEAFATLVSRHINMVYAVALRHVGNPHNAEEIAQAVFVILARKSRVLRRETILSGWLFQTAKLTAANFLRSETRRTRREQGAFMESNFCGEGDGAWKQIAPLLNDAIASLGEKDRNAIVLRYIKGLSLKEVGAALGGSEDAAKKRVSRAVERLRHFFHHRGVTLSAAVLTAGIAAHSVEAVPAGLAAAVTAAALKGTTLTASTSTLVEGTLKIMAWTKAKIAVAAGVAALVVVQSYEITRQNKDLASLRDQALAQNSKPAPEPTRIDSQKQIRADKLSLSNEVLHVRQQLALTEPTETKPPQTEVALSQDAPQEDSGRSPAAAQSPFEYRINPDGASITITNYIGPGGAVTIPTAINGLSVSSLMGTWSPLIGREVSITSSAFGTGSNVTSVTIPNNVTSIGEGAFNKCTNLADVTIPNSVTNIGNWAFRGCHSLASVTIPDSVRAIGKNAFFDCISLNTINIPNSVTSIGNWAFSECQSLTNATIGNGISVLGEHDFGFGLFYHCANLQAVCFKGNAPGIAGSNRTVFDENVIVYYSPDAKGWGPTFGGRPTKVWEP